MKFLTPLQLLAALTAFVIAVLLMESHLSNFTKGALGSRSISCMRQWGWLNCSRKGSGEVRGSTSYRGNRRLSVNWLGGTCGGGSIQLTSPLWQ